MKMNNKTLEYYNLVMSAIDKMGLSAENDRNRFKKIYIYDGIDGEDLVHIIEIKKDKHLILLDNFGVFIAGFNNIIEMVDFMLDMENTMNGLVHPCL